MYSKEIVQTAQTVTIAERVKNYLMLTKFRLSFLVVISAMLSYFLAAETFSWIKFLALIFGGYLVTGASNGLNQIIERDLDKLMNRTKNRPLPDGRMGIGEAFLVSAVMGFLGVFLLWFFLNPLSGILGSLALFIYVAIYTPLKRVTPFAVFVGAIPGAIPPMLGYIAETGTFGLIPGILFAVQFVWQFPHFWAIAWKVDDDYKRAGFSLLPSKGRKDKTSAFLILVYTIFLIPVSIAPWVFHISGVVSLWVSLLAGFWFLYYAVQLYFSLNDKVATKLMFASFIYLPVVQLIYLIDKI